MLPPSVAATPDAASDHARRESRPAPIDDARASWRALAPRLAARGRVRLSRDGGKNYPRKYERNIPLELPAQPAAVGVYDANGCAPVFVVDLDTAKGDRRRDHSTGLEHVDQDLAALTALLDRCGVRSWFSDRSPNGGRHVYIPFAEPIPFAEAATAARALAGRLSTADPLPMLGISDGCIRPPGAWHRTGGHQVLDQPLETALAALERPNDPLAWRRLLAALTRANKPLHAVSAHEAAASPIGRAEGPLPALPGHSEPDAGFQATARTGEYDQVRYASPSEARQSVIWSAAASGWSLVDVAQRIEDGRWPGLAALYARYRNPHKALARDWHKASAFEKERRTRTGTSSVRLRTTSRLKTQRGEVGKGPAGGPDVGPWVREWLAAVDAVHGPESDLSVRAVLYALAEAATLTRSLVIEHGNRSLAIATGLDHTAVGRALTRLLDEPSDRGLVDLVRVGRGVHASAYQLRIPALLAASAAEKPWRAGRIHAIRPVFRDLGLPAAFVYAALEQHAHEHTAGRAGATIGGRELAAAARLGVTATYDALAALAAWGLAEPTANSGWKLGTASLARLAEAWGIVDAIRAQLARYRAERTAWWSWLIAHGLLDPAHLERRGQPRPTRPGDAPPDPNRTHSPGLRALPAPPDAWFDDTASLLAMLHHELGAQLIDAS